MNLLVEMDLLNQYIRAHRYGLQYTQPDDMPKDPIRWLGTRLASHEFKLVIGVFLLLFDRGVLLEDVAGYAQDRTVPLPFEGVERVAVDSMLSDMCNRGLSQSEITRIIEMSGTMVDGYIRLGILGPIANSTEYEQSLDA